MRCLTESGDSPLGPVSVLTRGATTDTKFGVAPATPRTAEHTARAAHGAPVRALAIDVAVSAHPVVAPELTLMRRVNGIEITAVIALAAA